jgi:hypothetical protein
MQAVCAKCGEAYPIASFDELDSDDECDEFDIDAIATGDKDEVVSADQ